MKNNIRKLLNKILIKFIIETIPETKSFFTNELVEVTKKVPKEFEP